MNFNGGQQRRSVDLDTLFRYLRDADELLPSEVGIHIILEAIDHLQRSPGVVRAVELALDDDGHVRLSPFLEMGSELDMVRALCDVLTDALMLAGPEVPLDLMTWVSDAPAEERGTVDDLSLDAPAGTPGVQARSVERGLGTRTGSDWHRQSHNVLTFAAGGVNDNDPPLYSMPPPLMSLDTLRMRLEAELVPRNRAAARRMIARIVRDFFAELGREAERSAEVDLAMVLGEDLTATQVSPPSAASTDTLRPLVVPPQTTDQSSKTLRGYPEAVPFPPHGGMHGAHEPTSDPPPAGDIAVEDDILYRDDITLEDDVALENGQAHETQTYQTQTYQTHASRGRRPAKLLRKLSLVALLLGGGLVAVLLFLAEQGQKEGPAQRRGTASIQRKESMPNRVDDNAAATQRAAEVTGQRGATPSAAEKTIKAEGAERTTDAARTKRSERAEGAKTEARSGTRQGTATSQGTLAIETGTKDARVYLVSRTRTEEDETLQLIGEGSLIEGQSLDRNATHLFLVKRRFYMRRYVQVQPSDWRQEGNTWKAHLDARLPKDRDK